MKRPIVKEFQELGGSGVQFEVDDPSALLAHLKIRSTLVGDTKRAQILTLGEGAIAKW